MRNLLLLIFCTVVGTSLAQTGDTVDMYYYKNSLYNHLETGNSEATASTNVGNWIARFTAVPSNPKVATLGSVFGFFPQWSVPPKAQNFHSEKSTPHLQKWTASWDGAREIDLVAFVPDNFDGQHFDPADTTNMGEAYVTKLLYLIDQWDSNAPNIDRRYIVYAGWPALNRYGGTDDDPGTLTTEGIAKWQAYGLGDYQRWMELLVSQLKSERPALDIRLHNISKAVLMCHQNTVVKDIAADNLFEDLAPHGRASWYFLAAVAEYIEVFGEKPPADFSFDTAWGVDSVVTKNYNILVDYIWGVLKGSASSQQSEDVNARFILYPNPAKTFINIQTELPEYEIIVTNTVGEVIMQTQNTKLLNIQHLSDGVYQISIVGGAVMLHQTLVVQ